MSQRNVHMKPKIFCLYWENRVWFMLMCFNKNSNVHGPTQLYISHFIVFYICYVLNIIYMLCSSHIYKSIPTIYLLQYINVFVLTTFPNAYGRRRNQLKVITYVLAIREGITLNSSLIHCLISQRYVKM